MEKGELLEIIEKLKEHKLLTNSKSHEMVIERLQ